MIWRNPDARSKELGENDAFPFGVHKGEKMIAIPAQYLSWISNQEWISEWPAIVAYIKKNQKAINQDLKHRSREHDYRSSWDDSEDYIGMEY